MPATKNDNLSWAAVEKVPASVKPLYDAMLRDRKAATASREAFEQATIKAARSDGTIGKDKSLLFSYRFGRLSVAEVDASETKAKTVKRTFSFGRKG